MAGELERIDEEVARLQARRRHLITVQAALGGVARLLVVPHLPQVVPAVRAHHGFGTRGNLWNFIRQCLQAASPAALDTRTLATLVIDHFGLVFAMPKERQRFLHHSVGRTLNKLLARGEVERVSDPVAARHLPGIWRWNTGVPEIAELQQNAPRAAAVEP